MVKIAWMDRKATIGEDEKLWIFIYTNEKLWILIYTNVDVI